MSISEKLFNVKDLTGTEKEVAAYFAAHRARIASLTLSAVARNTFTSNATVLRLCKKLGYKGYREFQIAYAAEMYSLDSEAARTGDISQPATASETVIGLHLSSMSATAEHCRTAIDAGMLIRASSWVSGADNFYILGNGDALLVATAFASQLSQIGIHPILPHYYNESMSLITGITSKDTAMIVSFSRESNPSMERQLQCLAKKKCNIISITAKNDPIDADSLIKIPITVWKEDPLYGFRCRIMLDYILSCISELIKTREIR